MFRAQDYALLCFARPITSVRESQHGNISDAPPDILARQQQCGERPERRRKRQSELTGALETAEKGMEQGGRMRALLTKEGSAELLTAAVDTVPWPVPDEQPAPRTSSTTVDLSTEMGGALVALAEGLRLPALCPALVSGHVVAQRQRAD
jgi:hypothetical protein